MAQQIDFNQWIDLKKSWQQVVADNLIKTSIKNDINVEFSAGEGVTMSSNHLTPTIKVVDFCTENAIFSTLKKSVAASSGSNKVSRKVSTNARGYPYRKARLIDFNNSPSEKWFIIFYAWDIGKKKLIRKRVGKKELNKIVDLNERRDVALAEIRGINQQLKEGGYLSSSPAKTEIKAFNFHGYKILQALDWIHDYQRDTEGMPESTLGKFRYMQKNVKAFLKKEEIEGLLLRQVNTTFTAKLATYLKQDLKLANTTVNYLIECLHSGVEKLRKLDETILPLRNPFKFKKLTEIKRTHAAYSPEQLAKFVELIGPKDPQLLLFIRFIYYTLARPKREIRFIKIGHLRTDIKRILILGHQTKTNIEQYIGMSNEFKKIIEQSGVLNYPADHYVFSSNGKPGDKPVGHNYFYKRFRPFLDQLGFKKINDRYTLYSFKHTGAIQLYLKTRNMELLRGQMRHTTLSQTYTYIQELGQFIDSSELDDWKGF